MEEQHIQHILSPVTKDELFRAVNSTKLYKAIIQALYFFQDDYAWRGGDGQNFSFWDDQWIGDRPLKEMVNHLETKDEGILVHDVIAGNSTWELNRLRTLIHKEIKEKILVVPLACWSTTSDKVIWGGSTSSHYTAKAGFECLMSLPNPSLNEGH